MPRALFLLLICSQCWLLSDCSNWAQLSGSNVQNTVSSDEHPPWSKRWGFASVVVQQVALLASTTTAAAAPAGGSSAVPSPQPLYSPPSQLLILGGEDWVPDASQGSPAANPEAAVTSGYMGGTHNGYRQDLLGNALLPNAPPYDPASPSTGSGALSNDVFSTSGASWRIYTDHRQTNPFGEPAPVIASNVSWTMLKPWAGFPDKYKSSGWRDYLGCCHRTHPFVCNRFNICPANDEGVPYDNLLTSRRWSPRRGAAAVSVVVPTGDPAQVFVLGGRALSYTPLGAADGGSAFGFEDTVRSPTRLTNDVWVSTDYGATWDFTHAGCYTNDKYSVKYPGPQALACTHDANCTGYMNLGAGTVCWKGPLSDYGLSTPGQKGTCVCAHWSPREHHAAAVSFLTGFPAIYISGGISATAESTCGQWMCGSNTYKLNTDVWASSNRGATWEVKTAMAVPSEASGRSEHGLAYAAQLLYLVAGRGHAPGDRGSDAFYASTFTSQVGQTWSPAPFAPAHGPRAGFGLTTDGNALYMFGGAVPVAPPAPAAALGDVAAVEAAAAAKAAEDVAAASGKAVQGAVPGAGWSGTAAYEAARATLPGELLQGLQRHVTSHFFTMYVNDLGLQAAPFASAQRAVWYTDFANPAMPIQRTYIHPRWPLASPLDILNVSAAHAAVLASALGITDAAGLAAIAPASILLCADPAQLNIPPICAYKRAAQAFVAICAPRFRPWTTWNYDRQSAIGPARGGWPVLDWYASDNSRPSGWTASTPPADDGCAAAAGPPPDPYSGLSLFHGDYVCRSTPPPRRSGGLLAMDGQVYVAGGWLAPGTFTADLWVRDDAMPITNILHAPADGGGKEKALDTVLRLNCSNKVVCVFEARFFAGRSAADPGALLRDWALIPSEYECLPMSRAGAPVTLQVRAVDAAGNKDPSPLTATWTYVPPVPVGAIVLALVGTLALLLLAYWAYRRWRRRKDLEAFAKRRLARAAAERDRERRKYKKVRRLKKVKQVKAVRPKAFNPFSEDQADQQNRFKELLGVRAARSRGERLGLAADPLAATPVTTVQPPRPGPMPDLAPVALKRGAKSALDYDPAAISQKSAHELEKVARRVVGGVSGGVGMSVGGGLGRGVGGGGGSSSSSSAAAAAAAAAAATPAIPRDGAAADFFRTGLQLHADTLASKSKQGVLVEKIPLNLAQKAARRQARLSGRKEDDAWEISAMNRTLSEQVQRRMAGGGGGGGGASKKE